MIWYIKVLKVLQNKQINKKQPELINELSNVAGHIFNKPKSVAFLYINNKVSEREIKNPLSFPLAANNKMLRNKLNQRTEITILWKL